jgi:5-hydroxyisourate hydrolase
VLRASPSRAGLIIRETDSDGRCSTLLPADEKLSPGIYKMVFHTGPYFEASKVSSFYPLVEVRFVRSDRGLGSS